MNDLNLFEKELRKSGLVVQLNELLAKYSTIKVGGKADFIVTVENSTQLKEIVLVAREFEIPFLILGKGSNVIISDEGYQGLVIINTSKKLVNY